MNILSYSEIEELAERFLADYHPERTLPIPIENIVEISLEIQIITHKNLARLESIDAFLSSDLKELHIDEDNYMGRTNRSRFTLAHEVGHLVMHKKLVSQVASMNEWKRVVLQEGERRSLYEDQANDFAGCVLMPRDLLLIEFKKCKEIAENEFKSKGLKMPDDTTLSSYFASKIAPVFDVSGQAADIRLGKVLRKNK